MEASLKKNQMNRIAWGDFPTAITNGNLGSLKQDSDYYAAKAGDIVAARNLVNRLLKEETIVQMIEQIKPTKSSTVLLPVLAQESVGKNKIPLATAELISKKTGIPYTTSIFQTNHVGRTSKNGDSRLLFQATFGGHVEQNKDYILIDDTLTMGGTIASLRAFVMQNGGNVIGVMTMSSQQRSLQLAPTTDILENIKRKHGQEIEFILQKELGYGLQELTNSEAAHIYAYENVNTFRSRLAQARYVESGGVVRSTTATAQSEDLQLARLTALLRENNHPKAIIKTQKSTVPCRGEIIYIENDLIIQQVDSHSRYFQMWHKEDITIPLNVGDKVKIYADHNGQVHAQVKDIPNMLERLTPKSIQKSLPIVRDEFNRAAQNEQNATQPQKTKESEQTNQQQKVKQRDR